MGCFVFSHGGLKAPASLKKGEGIRFSGPAAFKLQAKGWPKSSLVVPKLAAGFNLQLWPKAKRPSDAAGWPSGQTEPACWRRAEQTCEPQSVAPAEGGRPQKKAPILRQNRGYTIYVSGD
ncbi:hypothetical protein SGRA_2384 [Saprospira grandis str. Lewin]|uniref:Uncharacterized protein n=1 Tax=Saprospira grandis (strain Lewin) TaxID=984262 RepID=H6L4T8_SAPGL|nr:hypothetical protein SGRA_2384 [Saprospira grandis str. Lewin]